MPDLATPPVLDHHDFDDDSRYHFSSDSLTARQAANLVTQSFTAWDAHNQTRRDRASQAMALYLAQNSPVRYWPGTKIRRHHIPSHLVFDHVEAAYPLLSTSIFNQEPYWFDVLPARDSTPTQARALQQILAYAYEPDPSSSELTGVLAAKAALFTGMLYGNSYSVVGFEPTQRRAFVEYVSVYDVHLPPRTGPFVDSAHAWIRRRLVSVEDLEQLRDDPRLTLPPLAVLNAFATLRHRGIEDFSKLSADDWRGLASAVGREETNPTARPVEVLVYEEKNREIWVVERSVTIYNEPNPLGMLSLIGAPLLWVPDSHHGLGFAETLEPEQRMDYGLHNEFFDQLALQTTPPRTHRQSMLDHPSRTAWRPGATIQSRNENDFTPQAFQTALQEVIVALGMNRGNASRRTGINEMTQQGLPTPSNANRTGIGVQAQAGAVQQRQFRPIENFENFYLLESLRKIQRVLRVHAGSQSLVGLGEDGAENVFPAAMVAGGARFRVLASSKALARTNLLPVLPMILQFYLNPQVMEQALRVGKTVDFTELERLVQDATATRDRYRIVRPVTQEEQQAVAAGSVDQQLAAESDERQADTRLQAAQLKAETEREKIAAQDRKTESDASTRILELVSGDTKAG